MEEYSGALDGGEWLTCLPWALYPGEKNPSSVLSLCGGVKFFAPVVFIMPISGF